MYQSFGGENKCTVRTNEKVRGSLVRLVAFEGFPRSHGRSIGNVSAVYLELGTTFTSFLLYYALTATSRVISEAVIKAMNETIMRHKMKQ